MTMIFRTFDDSGRFIPAATAHALVSHARALQARAAQLEEASGRTAHRRMLARNRYTVDPVYWPNARAARADRLYARAKAILDRLMVA